MAQPRGNDPRLPRAKDGPVLVLNAGSSSLKFALFPAGAAAASWRGKIERLGMAEPTLSVAESGGAAVHESLPKLSPEGAFRVVAERVSSFLGGSKGSALIAVGHRIVHGGPDFAAPVHVNPEVLTRLRAMEPYDPAHQAVELGYIEAAERRWPDLPQVACFDTAFHRELPEVAQRLPVSAEDVARGLRRYGFHGLSYTHLMAELRRTENEHVGNGRVVLAHLGNGASLAAVRGGRCVDTTMGFSPTGGIPMSTRSGDLDPGVLLWLARNHGWSIEELFEFATRRSGLLAISGTTSDLRDLLEREATDPRAAAAVELFCFHVRKTIGAFAAELGGLDGLVFTGGIGEHQSAVRERICAGLDFLGLTLDRERNASHAPTISPAGADVVVRVIPADEERVIAQAVREVLQP